MKRLILFAIAILAINYTSASKSRRRLIKNLETEKVVPDAIDTLPKLLLKVKYIGEEKNTTVNYGNVLKPSQTKNQPCVSWKAKSRKKALYTLIFIDIDVPSRDNPNRTQFCHWLVGNIKGRDISTGEVIITYMGSGTPKDTGFHRYVFIVYKQPKNITFAKTKIPGDILKGRSNFDARKFAEKYNLGEPIAANFYKAEWEPYVDEFMKTFKDTP